jgi:hypothetical protein
MAESVRSAEKMAKILIEEPDKLDLMKSSPAESYKIADRAIKEAGLPDIPPSPVYRMVVGALGLIGVIAIIGAIVLVALGKNAPDVLVALGSASVGALAGLLMPVSK